jgi:late competence protein required for DNA uptake (superfamily II DNA/RNA helicase)
MKLKHGKRIRGIDRCFKCGRRRAEILLGKVYYCRECVYLSLNNEKLDNFYSKDPQ